MIYGVEVNCEGFTYTFHSIERFGIENAVWQSSIEGNDKVLAYIYPRKGEIRTYEANTVTSEFRKLNEDDKRLAVHSIKVFFKKILPRVFNKIKNNAYTIIARGSDFLYKNCESDEGVINAYYIKMPESSVLESCVYMHHMGKSSVFGDLDAVFGGLDVIRCEISKQLFHQGISSKNDYYKGNTFGDLAYNICKSPVAEDRAKEFLCIGVYPLVDEIWITLSPLAFMTLDIHYIYLDEMVSLLCNYTENERKGISTSIPLSFMKDKEVHILTPNRSIIL